jgi:hypothetical protein
LSAWIIVPISRTHLADALEITSEPIGGAVTFDSRTNTIGLKEDGDLLADSDSFFLKVFKDLGGRSGASVGLAAD